MNVADFGRSPRAQFHAASLSAEGWDVTVLANPGSPAFDHVANDVGIRRVNLVESMLQGRGIVGLWRKAVLFRRSLQTALERLEPQPDVLFVMTPPAVPVLDVVRRWWRSRPSVRVVVDWHNLGHTRLAKRWGSWNPLVHHYRNSEFAPWPEGVRHLAVSTALASHVSAQTGCPSVQVLHDANPAWRCFPNRDRCELLRRWGQGLEGLDPDALWLVHPHSWSDDECPEWILDALKDLRSSRMVQVIITGDGPLRRDFERRARSSGVGGDRLLLPFLPPEAYVALMANADWGLCPHTSSSGLDLPMKLADMRGAGLPALVYRYGSVLHEVFSEPDDGRFFDSAGALCEAVQKIADGVWRGSAPRPSPGREAGWNRVVRPLLES